MYECIKNSTPLILVLLYTADCIIASSTKIIDFLQPIRAAKQQETKK